MASDPHTPANLRRVAQRLLPLIDFTSLNDNDTSEVIERLCARARTPAGNVAAVCIHAPHIPVAKRALAGSDVPIATVTNFPAGASDVEAAADETRAAVALGADEVDVVFPYGALIAGGADFIKTSTGKTQPGASLEAAQIMLDAIAAARGKRRWVGFKASGGVRTV